MVIKFLNFVIRKLDEILKKLEEYDDVLDDMELLQ